VEYYKKEFHNDRLFYEVVKRGDVQGFDKLFSKTKFSLLRTSTTDLKRKMAYEIDKRPIKYYLGLLVNRIFGRPLIRQLVRFLDFHLVRNSEYKKYFDTYKPDLVFCAHLFDEPEIQLIREAKKRGVKSIGYINTWDKVTGRALIRLLPDKAIVFNEIVKKEMMEHNEMKAEDLFVSGLPQYDAYFKPTPSSQEEFMKKIGITADKKLIVYASMGSAFSDADWDMIDLLYFLERDGKLGNTAVLVRFQPNDFFNEEEVKKRPFMRYDYPGKRFSSKRGVDWDMDAGDIQHLVDTLYHASLVICFASSIGIDSALFGRAVIKINF